MSEIKSVIMAGGIGARFWPLSRRQNPKQFLSLTGDLSLIEETARRLQRLSKPEDIYIISNHRYSERLTALLPGIPRDNIFFEPVQRNTAPCIGLAATVIEQRHPGSVMAIFPSDHLIGNERAFTGRIREAAAIAGSRDVLMTIGVEPTRPETGYGYIQLAGEIQPGCHQVRTFAEKPNLATAQRFISSGDFLWNSGIFVWRSSVFLQALQQHLEDVYDVMTELKPVVDTPEFEAQLQRVFPLSPSVSVDYGILEQSRNVAVIRAKFPWSDVGSWQEAYLRSPKDQDQNVIQGEVIAVDASGNYVRTEAQRLIALVGVKDLVVIDTGDALLVARRDTVQDVSQIVNQLREEEKDEYL